jgi:hypothetical protein
MTKTPEYDPSILGPVHEIDLFSPEIVAILKEQGALYKRKLEPIRGVRDPEQIEHVVTMVERKVETISIAEPGSHKIIMGAYGEEYVLTTDRFNELYDVVPRERQILALKNPYERPIKIQAPWSTPEKPAYQEGGPEAFMAFALDDKGNLTDDRYIIGGLDPLNANYEPLDFSKPVPGRAAVRLLKALHMFGHPRSDMVWDESGEKATCRCGWQLRHENMMVFG